MIRRSKRMNIQMFIMIVVLLAMYAFPFSAFAAQHDKAEVMKDVTIKVDGEVVKMADPVLMLEGRLFAPVSRAAELFHAKKISWDKMNEEATIHTTLGDKIVLGNGVPVVYFNDARYVMDAVPFLTDGRMYVPLRHVAELLHATVKWDAEEQTAAFEAVQPAVVADDFGLREISKEFGSSSAELLKRNGLESADKIKEGTALRVVIPSIFANEAKPFTEKEYMLLAKITQIEAGYESYEGQLAVANVILNRVKDSRFPGSIHDVIYSGKQFPPAHNGLLEKSVPNASVLRAAKDALNGKNNVENAIYFFNPKVSKGSFWSSLDVIETIGHHSFAK